MPAEPEMTVMIGPSQLVLGGPASIARFRLPRAPWSFELAARFGRDHQPGEEPFVGGRYAVESYLDHHAEKLVRRFDANSYLVLSTAMNHHDVGRDRGGIAAALCTVTAQVSIAGMSSDWLYPVRLQQELGELIPTSSAVEIVQTISGHDGFLVETEPLGRIIRRALD